MDREEFMEKLKTAPRVLDIPALKEQYHRFILTSPFADEITGQRQLIIFTEEVSELIVELCKDLSGNLDPIGILEELADITICMFNLADICELSHDELIGAIQEELQNRTGEAVFYQEPIRYWCKNPDIRRDFVINAIRTLSSMSQMVAKKIRGKATKEQILPAAATILLIQDIRCLYRITAEEYHAAINVKTDRGRRVLEENGYYQ